MASAVQTKVESDESIILTKGELLLLIKSEAKRYTPYVFRMLLNEQLNGYFPAIKAARDCSHNITYIFHHKDIAMAIINYFRGREASGYLRPETSQLELRDSLANVLKERASELGRAPLMAELSGDTAFDIWVHFGTWNGALKHAGITPLTGKNMEKAVGEYGISAASPRLVRKDFERQFIREDRIKFNKAEINALAKLCDRTRELKRPPRREEIPADVLTVINRFTCSYQDLLCHLGIILHHIPVMPSKLGKRR